MKTRIILLLSFTLLFAVSSCAQDAMPTKEETVNYINKRLQEMVDKEYEVSEKGTLLFKSRYTSISFVLKGDNAELEYSSESRSQRLGNTRVSKDTWVFNPTYISADSGAVSVKTDSLVLSTGGYLTIKLEDKVVRRQSYSSYDGKVDKEVTNVVFVPFDPKIPDHGKRLIKALLHLRDLAKAEDDPFGN
jgi:hypothetical protein